MKRIAAGIGLVLLAVPTSGLAADAALFKKLDTDKSGSVSRDELLKSDLILVDSKGGKKKVKHRDMLKDAKAAAMTEEQKNKLFENIDTDRNGTITRKEWSRASQDGFILMKF